MATIAGAGILSAVMALTASGHVLKTTSFDLIVIDAWPGEGSVSASSGLSAVGHAVRQGIAALDAVSAVTGTGHRIRGGQGTIAASAYFTGECRIKGYGVFGATLTVSGVGQKLAVGKGSMSAVSVFGAVADEYTIANKQFYIKSGGAWTQIFPVASVIGDWDGGTW